MRTVAMQKTLRFVEDFIETGKLNYTLSERMNLLRARLSRQQKAKILNFDVEVLNQGSIQIALREIFILGEYRFDSHVESPLILDCGANMGLATLYFKHVYPAARIVAFEADPKIAALLRDNVCKNNLQNVTVHNLMLTAGEGEYTFFAEGEGTLTGSSIPGRNAGPPMKVQGARLSSFVNETVHLLKLDVEGAEFDVMADLITTGKIALVERMIIEYHHKINGTDSKFSEFLALLETNGFEYQIAAKGCAPITRQGITQDILIGVYRRPA